MAELNPPVAMQNRTDHSALTIRTLSDALTGSSAVVGVNDLKVSQRAAGANMSVDVAGGLCVIEGTESATQGAYVCRSDATPTNVAIAASNASLARIDLIVAKVQDAFYSGATNAWSIVAVTGTASGSPVAPGAPVNSLTLAQILVPAASTSVVNANITDKRVIGRGNLYTGDFPCTSATRPAAPWTGMTILETDTFDRQIWSGSAWLLLGKAGAIPHAMASGTFTWSMTTATNVTVTPVNFPASRFSVAPIVTCTQNSAGANTSKIIVRAFNITTSKFDANMSTGDASALSVASETIGWTAIQMTPTTAAG
jgi:hypothetical protein